MLEKLPEAVGEALEHVRAGLTHTLFHTVDLRPGTARIQVGSLSFIDHAQIPARFTADGEGLSPPLHWSGVPADAVELVLVVEDADSPTPLPLVHAIVHGLRADQDGTGALSEGAFDGATGAPGGQTAGLEGADDVLETRADSGLMSEIDRAGSNSEIRVRDGAGDGRLQPGRGEAGDLHAMNSASDKSVAKDVTASASLDRPVAMGRNSLLMARWLPPDPPPGHGVHRYVFQLWALEAGDPLPDAPGRDAVAQALAQRAIASGCLIGTYERPSTRIHEPLTPQAPALAR